MGSLEKRCSVEAALERGTRMGREAGGGFLVAYSAGPDSTALLAAAAALGLPGLAAAYIDHGIRPKAEREAELALARRTCARLGLALGVARVRPGAVEALACAAGIGVEAAARRYRYHALRELRSRRDATWVLTAHNLDDQLETAIMRFLSGSGAGGLRGIPPVNGHFLRPFLSLPKAELIAYIEARGLEHSTDSTNASTDYARNKVRLELGPYLDRAFPGWRRGVELAARKAALEEAALSKACETLLFRVVGAGRMRRASSDAGRLLTAPDALAARAIVDAEGKVLGRGRASSRLALAALDSLRRGAEYKGGGLFFAREGELVVISRSLDFPRHGGYFVVIDGPCSVRAKSLAVSASWVAIDDPRSVQGIRADAFSFPLVVRSRLPGDELALPGGTKRLDVLLSEMGLAPSARDRIPIVEDRVGIVAALGSVFGLRNRYRRGPEFEGGRRLVINVKGA